MCVAITSVAPQDHEGGQLGRWPPCRRRRTAGHCHQYKVIVHLVVVVVDSRRLRIAAIVIRGTRIRIDGPLSVVLDAALLERRGQIL